MEKCAYCDNIIFDPSIENECRHCQSSIFVTMTYDELEELIMEMYKKEQEVLDLANEALNKSENFIKEMKG